MIEVCTTFWDKSSASVSFHYEVQHVNSLDFINIIDTLNKFPSLLALVTAAAADTTHRLINPFLAAILLDVSDGKLPQLLHARVVRKPNISDQPRIEPHILTLLVLRAKLEPVHVPGEVLGLSVRVGRKVHHRRHHARQVEPRAGRRLGLDVSRPQTDDAGDLRRGRDVLHEFVACVPQLVDGVVVEQAAVPEDEVFLLLFCAELRERLLGWEGNLGEEGGCCLCCSCGEADGDLVLVGFHDLVG